MSSRPLIGVSDVVISETTQGGSQADHGMAQPSSGGPVARGFGCSRPMGYLACRPSSSVFNAWTPWSRAAR